MSTLVEIEAAAKRLSRSEQAILVYKLQGALREKLVPAASIEQPPAEPQPLKWPDFEARLRAIYGDHVMPNMVLEERAMTER